MASRTYSKDGELISTNRTKIPGIDNQQDLPVKSVSDDKAKAESKSKTDKGK